MQMCLAATVFPRCTTARVCNQQQTGAGLAESAETAAATVWKNKQIAVSSLRLCMSYLSGATCTLSMPIPQCSLLKAAKNCMSSMKSSLAGSPARESRRSIKLHGRFDPDLKSAMVVLPGTGSKGRSTLILGLSRCRATITTAASLPEPKPSQTAIRVVRAQRFRAQLS